MARKAARGESVKDELDEMRRKHFTIVKELGIYGKELEPLFDCLGKALGIIQREREESSEYLDSVASFGERFSSRILAEYLRKNEVDALAYDAFDLGMVTTDNFGHAEPLPATSSFLRRNINRLKHIPIITGYIGITEEGKITTLSRGGCDYSAAIIGSALKADEIQIWTDVDGVMSADPYIVDNARTIDLLSFDEASELAAFGTRIMHPRTLLPAIEKRIPVRVLNSFNPVNKGTTVVRTMKSDRAVKAVAARKGISLLNISSARMLEAFGYLARVFDVFAKHRKSVDMISTSEVSISLTVNTSRGVDRIVDELRDFAHVDVENHKALVCVVGDGMREEQGIVSKIFSSVEHSGMPVHMISQGASKNNISFIVDEDDADKAVRLLHQMFA